MDKKDALEFFNGTTNMARELGVASRTVRTWPETLNQSQIKMVIGAAIAFRGLVKARAWFPDHVPAEGAAV